MMRAILGIADHGLRHAARDKWQVQGLRIDDEPEFVRTHEEKGAWVQAWVWVSDEDRKELGDG